MIKFNIVTYKGDVDNVVVQAAYEPLVYDYMSRFVKYSEYIGFINKRSGNDYGTISKSIINYMRMKDDSIVLLPFWMQEYCRRGGVNKRLFFDYEQICVEIAEFIISNIVECEISISGEDEKMKVALNKKYGRMNEDTTRYMKRMKRVYNKGRSNCPVDKVALPPGYIYPCCACRDKDIIIAKYVK